MLESIDFSEVLVSGGGLVAVAGWVYTSVRANREAKTLLVNSLITKVDHIERNDIETKEHLRRVHDRIDILESSHEKLETKLDKDISEVKGGIDKLTTLVIQALQRGER